MFLDINVSHNVKSGIMLAIDHFDCSVPLYYSVLLFWHERNAKIKEKPKKKHIKITEIMSKRVDMLSTLLSISEWSLQKSWFWSIKLNFFLFYWEFCSYCCPTFYLHPLESLACKKVIVSFSLVCILFIWIWRHGKYSLKCTLSLELLEYVVKRLDNEFHLSSPLFIAYSVAEV